jgi:competence protein ComFB
MGVHNLMEEAVAAEIEKICDSMQKEIRLGNKQYEGICTCPQCKLDAACYVLNRIQPSYIVSNRGAARAAMDTFERQQKLTDISILVYEALLQVGHNRRPEFDHSLSTPPAPEDKGFFFNIPAIYGRILNGANFAPISGVDVRLIASGALVHMKDPGWSNPCALISKTGGTYTFWPRAERAQASGESRVFNYTILVEAQGFEPLVHTFAIPIESGTDYDITFSMSQAFKLADLYLFPSEQPHEV